MTATPIQGEPTERELFEQWAINNGFPIRRMRNPEGGRDYGSDNAQDAWEAWQAARSLPATDAGDAGDAARLDWLERNLFERKWGGTLGQPSEYYVRGDFRHTTQRMRGETLRQAIDRAIAKQGAQP